jgi:hypothetical protein
LDRINPMGNPLLCGGFRPIAPGPADEMTDKTFPALAPIADRPHWWQWITVLSLDAPLVAVLWQWQLARVAGVQLRVPFIFVLGASVWLAYAADRWLEGWRLEPDRVRTQRHRFYQQQRWPVAVIWIGLVAADVATAAAVLDRRVFALGCALLFLVAAYLLSHQSLHRHLPLRPPKEACVALLMGLGAVLFVAAAPGAALARLPAPLALFVLLCLANCLLISTWEIPVDEIHGQTSLVRQFPAAGALGRGFPWILAAACLLYSTGADGPSRSAAFCAAAGSLLLVLVDRIQARVGWALARVLSDVALMTPLIPLCRHLAAGGQ